MRFLTIPAAVVTLAAMAAGQSAADYLKQIRDADAEKRREAAALLQNFTPSEAAIGALVEATADQAPEVRGAAANSLGRYGADARRAIPAVVELLSDGDSRVRMTAAYAVGNFGPAAAAALPKLQALLLDEWAEVRTAALSGIRGLGTASAPAQGMIVQRLHDANANVRSAALSALGHIGRDARNYLPEFTAALADSDEAVRGGAADAIRALGEPAASALPALAEALRIPSFRSQGAIIDAIYGIGVKHAAAIVPVLVEVLNDPDSTFAARANVAHLLADIGEPAKVAIPDLVNALNADHDWIRSAALSSLLRLNPGMTREQVLAMGAGRRGDADKPSSAHSTGVAKWIAVLTGDDAAERDRAAVELGKAGVEAVMPLVQVLTTDTSEPVRMAALRALHTIGYRAQAAIPALAAIVTGANSTELRAQAVRVLGEMKSNTGPAVDALKKAVAVPALQADAVTALGGIGAEAAGAAPLIRDVLEHAKTAQTRVAAIRALGEIGAPAQATAPAVTPFLSDGDRDVRAAAAYALGKMRPPVAVAALTKALDDSVEWNRAEVAFALGQIFVNPEGRAAGAVAVPALIERLKDPSVRVRKNSAYALGWSGAPAAAMPLIQALKDQAGEVRGEAAMSLGTLSRYCQDSSAAGPAVEALIPVLQDNLEMARIYAAQTLGWFGPISTPALPALERASQDDSAAVRQAVARAIAAIIAKP